MAELDTREVEAQLERARATLNSADAAFRRATEMHDRAIVTDAEFEQAKAAFGYVPDTPNLYGKLTGWEFLQFMSRLYRVPRDQAEGGWSRGTGVVVHRTVVSGSARCMPHTRRFYGAPMAR